MALNNLAQPGPLLCLPGPPGAHFPLSLWNSAFFSAQMSPVYLNLTFQPFILIFFSPFAYVWGLWKSEPEEKKNKYSDLFLRMPLLFPFLRLCSRHKASISISCGSFSPGLFYSRVQWRICSHLVNSNIVFLFFKIEILLLRILTRHILLINIINYISNKAGIT